MRLEIVNFPVRDVKFGKRTSYNKGVLELDKNELLKLIREDKRIASAELDIAFPGEQTRIAFARDTVEPRIKVSGPGCVFPGIMGAPETVGEGRTHRLSGMAVTISAQYHEVITSGTDVGSVGFIDMWGMGSELSPYGSLINVVPVIKLVDGINELEAHSSIQLAEYKLARRLAETTREKLGEDIEVFELGEADPSLPRVVYDLSYHVEPGTVHSRVSLYGLPIREGLPVFMHPNEFLDGAVTPDARQGGISMWQTWQWLNHPVVLNLLREHGKSVNFLGVIMHRASFYTEVGKEAMSTFTAHMAKLLKAQGAILTGIPFLGNTFFGVMLTVQAYEKKGIKTVLVTAEASHGGAGGAPLIFCVPEANAIVDTGDAERKIELSAPAKVLGCKKGQLIADTAKSVKIDPWGSLKLEGYNVIQAAVDAWGGMKFTVREY
jgi:glycine reductase